MPSDYDPLERELAQFDEDMQRRPSRRTWRFLPIAIAVLALAVFGVIVWYAYSKGVREGSEVAAPLLKPDGPMKVAPENPGGLQVPHQEKTVYNQIDERADDSRIERLLPPPEAPQPVPVFPPTTSGGAAADATGTALPTVKDAPAGAAPGAAAASNGATASKEPPLPSPELAKPPQPPTIANPPQPEPSKKTESAEKPTSVEKAIVKKEAKAEPSKAAVVTNRQGYKVQIGSMRSEAAARKQWQVQSAKHKDLLGDLTLDIDRAEIPGKGTYYRVQAGMLPSAEAAKKICTELAKRKTGCIVVRP